MDAAPDGGGGDVVTAGVVKRGGNLRWISPTNGTPSSGGASEVKRVRVLNVVSQSVFDGEAVLPDV